MAFAYGDLEYVNRNGTRSTALMSLSELLLASKNTVSLLLILVVSMGFGVVKYLHLPCPRPLVVSPAIHVTHVRPYQQASP